MLFSKKLPNERKPIINLNDEDKEQRKRKANIIIIDAVFWAIGVAFIYIPLIDFLYIVAVQLKLINELCSEYQIQFSKTQAKAIIFAFLGYLGVQILVKTHLIRVIPGLGSISGAWSTAIFAGAITYAIGQVFVRHFELGGTLINFKAIQFKEYFLQMYQEGTKVAQTKHR